MVQSFLRFLQQRSLAGDFGVRSVAGWTTEFDVAVSLENTYSYFAEL